MHLLRHELTQLKRVAYPQDAARVHQTVSQELCSQFTPGIESIAVDTLESAAAAGTLLLGIAGEPGVEIPEGERPGESWLYFQYSPQQGGRLIASHRHFLYGLWSLVSTEWAGQDSARWRNGVFLKPAFDGVVGFDGHYGFWRRFTVGYDPEAAIRETARMGCRYVAVNALPSPNAYETGPIGEVYFRFYQYLPDLDQYVDTRLNHGIYPPEYLHANLHFLKEQSERAVRYGLTPGMHVANPRSAPETFFQRYPYLRGPRIDHTFRCYEPRYTMTLTHPVVRWHYATLLEKLLRECPEIGFLSTLINDSGSGFEYTESLYPGRNGGPYMVREWRSHAEIARRAAELVIKYYRGMRDTGRKVNPDFRILLGLNNIEEEKQIIYDGLEDGLDRLDRTQRYDSQHYGKDNEALEKKGSRLVSWVPAEGNPYVLGVPSPFQTVKNLQQEQKAGASSMELDFDPPSSAPFDVNRSVARAFILGLDDDPESAVRAAAEAWAGSEHAPGLVELWRASDQIAANAPVWPLFGNQGFAWYRMWTRPIVPDIGKIPVRERAYYEDYILTHFNNPHNVDFKADCLWEIHTVEEMQAFLDRYNDSTLPALEQLVKRIRTLLKDIDPVHSARGVLDDLEQRLSAYYHYNRTLRNVAAWIVHVHGYLRAGEASLKQTHAAAVQALIDNELENTRAFISFSERATIHFMPIHERGQWMHDYGPDFIDGLHKKVSLMEQYRNETPYIDPNYMWRLPHRDEVELAPDVPPEEYLKFL
ncbi:MAG TPA: hypothetical protein VJ960_03010 [Oceanipulchritudo sp.]|nr:hypothetical protein [Oceanipulchritudo sp.]